ncbi:DgyrCDS8550 [Dimorphilus gyrociliatus]|uniref:DgyrCDS8550 n=1 Tax=Dimorphilus gyrociliatus TaxID=2664684 RepID=A0A7I8VZL8_9ANNE|nr:DgyrCDS8550 [Dimorphilus gyrociliatus]
MFNSEDSGDNDFNLQTGGSKLSSLFDNESIDIGTTLSYKAPKEPKSNVAANQTTKTVESAVLCAFVVNTFKLENKEYTSFGKLGCALIKYIDNKPSQLLLYKTKQQPVASVNVSSSFNLTVQKRNYVTFYDDRRQNWSILFEKEKDIEKLCLLVSLETFASGHRKEVVFMNLYEGEGDCIEEKDALESSIEGWALKKMTLENPLKKEILKFRIGSHKMNKILEDKLIGAKKTCRIILIIPADQNIKSSKWPFPEKCDLLLLISIDKVKRNKATKEVASPESSVASSPTHTPVPEQNTTQTNTNSSETIQEPTANSTNSRAQILSKMAKLGQPLIPMFAGGSNPSEPEEEETAAVKSPKGSPEKIFPSKPKPQIVSKPQIHMKQEPASPQSAYSQNFPVAQNYPTKGLPGQVAIYQTPSAFQPLPPQNFSIPQQNDNMTQILLSEQRTQNTEIRLAIGKVQDKVENVLDKLEKQQQLALNQQQSQLSYKQSESFDALAFAASYQKLHQENSKLIEEVDAKRALVQKLNEKVSELLLKNQQYVEQSTNLLEEKHAAVHKVNVHTQQQLSNLETENNILSMELNQVKDTLTKKTNELNSYKEMLFEQKRLAESLSETEVRLNIEMASAITSNKDLESVNTKLTKDLKDALRRVSLLEEIVEKLEASNKAQAEQMEVAIENSKKNEEEIRLTLIEKMTNDHKESLKVKEISMKEERRLEVDKLKETYESKIADLTQQFEDLQKTKEDNYQLELQKNEDEREKLAAKYKKFVERTKLMKLEYENEITQLKESLTSSKHNVGGTDVGAHIKKIMNGFYKEIKKHFTRENTYEGEKINTTILEIVKDVTLSALQPQSHIQVTNITDKHTEKNSETQIEEAQTENKKEKIVATQSEVEEEKVEGQAEIKEEIHREEQGEIEEKIHREEQAEIKEEIHAQEQLENVKEKELNINVEKAEETQLTTKKEEVKEQLLGN